MGYYSERLRQRLEKMTQEEKKELFDKLSYLNEFGPVVTNYTEWVTYDRLLVFSEVTVPNSSPYIDVINYRYAA